MMVPVGFAAQFILQPDGQLRNPGAQP